MKKLILILIAFVLFSGLHAQTELKDTREKKHFFSSTIFMMANLFPVKDPPKYYQLNYGYRISPKDALFYTKNLSKD